VPREVAQVNELELSVAEHETDAHVIVRIGLWRGLVLPTAAKRVRRSRALERMPNRFARRHHDVDIDALQWNAVAGLEDAALALGLFDVSLVLRRDVRAADFDGLAVIEILLDRDQFGERLHGADMVAVE